MSTTAKEIIEAKQTTNGYLWLQATAGDVILWPSEEQSRDDDGARAIARWRVSPDVEAELIASGCVDEVN